MSMKLLAIGNVLMGDDAVAIYLATKLQDELTQLGIEVFYAETDIEYCITCINDGDYIIFVDAADFGGVTGEVSLLSFDDIFISSSEKLVTGHGINFLDIIKLYELKIQGVILAVQIADISFRYGLSEELQNQFSDCASQIMKHINKVNAKNENRN